MVSEHFMDRHKNGDLLENNEDTRDFIDVESLF